MSATQEDVRKQAYAAICILAAAENLLEMAEREGPHGNNDVMGKPIARMIDQIHALSQKLLKIHDIE